MKQPISRLLLSFLGCSLALWPKVMFGATEPVNLAQSVELALRHSPQLQALMHGQQAATADLKQAGDRYYPTVDVMVGYGPSQYSDRNTRLPQANVGNEEWSKRTDATLKLSQKVYDGGETRHTISVQQAMLDTAGLAVREAAQTTALEAITAHLDVFRQQQLLALAEKDLQVHAEIVRALAELEQAGTGDLADVSQTQTRIAWAESNLAATQANLAKATSQYLRVVGQSPGPLAYAEVPAALPTTLAEVLSTMEQKNPSLLASSSKVAEAEARMQLARATLQPKLNLELSNGYYNNIEGEDSWRQTGEAMVVLRWNLFNGGRDNDAIDAAVARAHESRFRRTDRLVLLRDTATSAWTTFTSLQRQKAVYKKATDTGKTTFEAYLKQFTISRRTLLDVLNAEREFFQSAQKLITVSVDEVIAAYMLLQVEGVLGLEQIPRNLRAEEQYKVLLLATTFPVIRPLLYPNTNQVLSTVGKARIQFRSPVVIQQASDGPASLF